MHGWICPRCQRVNSPLVMECPCSRERVGIDPPRVDDSSRVTWGTIDDGFMVKIDQAFHFLEDDD